MRHGAVGPWVLIIANFSGPAAPSILVNDSAIVVLVAGCIGVASSERRGRTRTGPNSLWLVV
jgi:hypothetical protein